MVYTTAERIEIIFIYGMENRCLVRTARTYNERHPGQNLNHVTVRNLVAKFEATGSVNNNKNCSAKATQ